MICRGDTVTITADYGMGKAPYALTWDDNSTNDNRTVVPTTDSTWYVYQVVDACHQSAKDSILVWMAPDPYAGFSYLNNPGVPLRVDFYNSSVNGDQFHWDFGDGGIQI